MHASTCTRLDYGKAVYTGLTISLIDHLQPVLNVVAQLISGTSRFGHISSFIWEELHMLPIQKQIEFKILMLTCLAWCGPFLSHHHWFPTSPKDPGQAWKLCCSRSNFLECRLPAYNLLGLSFSCGCLKTTLFKCGIVFSGWKHLWWVSVISRVVLYKSMNTITGMASAA